jgi:DNA mismatch endonuclease, patch repair protein
MRAVSGPETAPERALRLALRDQGLRGYRLHPRDVLGRPDLVYTGLKLAVFIDGCFWHGCPEHCRRPSSNAAYWGQKIDRNAARRSNFCASC